jgi:hypothetical protein
MPPFHKAARGLINATNRCGLKDVTAAGDCSAEYDVKQRQYRFLHVLAISCIGGDDRYVGVELEGSANRIDRVDQIAIEAVEHHDERDLTILEVVNRGEAIIETAGINQHDGAECTGDQIVPHETKPILSRSTKQVQHKAAINSNATEVHGDGGGGLGGHLTSVINANSHTGHGRFGRERRDVRDGANEGGLAHTKATRDHNLHWDRCRRIIEGRWLRRVLRCSWCGGMVLRRISNRRVRLRDRCLRSHLLRGCRLRRSRLRSHLLRGVLLLLAVRLRCHLLWGMLLASCELSVWFATGVRHCLLRCVLLRGRRWLLGVLLGSEGLSKRFRFRIGRVRLLMGGLRGRQTLWEGTRWRADLKWCHRQWWLHMQR